MGFGKMGGVDGDVDRDKKQNMPQPEYSAVLTRLRFATGRTTVMVRTSSSAR